MLNVLKIEAAILKLAQPSRPPAAIERGRDSYKQMLPPTGQSGEVRGQSCLVAPVFPNFFFYPLLHVLQKVRICVYLKFLILF